MVIIFLALLVLSSAQCPYCQSGNCSITSPGNFGNCSVCVPGTALLSANIFADSTPGNIWSVNVGICQPCPVGCQTCQQTVLSPAMSSSFIDINCTQCASGYVYNWVNGGCVICGAHCSACQCGTECGNTICTACYYGYQLNTTYDSNTCIPSTTITQEENQNPSESTATVVGLAVWGTVMTIVVAVFIFLWHQRKNQKQTLLQSEQATRTVSF